MSAADRRRMGLVLSATIVVLAVGVAALPMIQGSMSPGGIDGHTITLAPGMSAGGCDGGSFTPEGLLIGSVLEIGAVAIAWLTATATGPSAA